jgi:hypothetical protein
MNVLEIIFSGYELKSLPILTLKKENLCYT